MVNRVGSYYDKAQDFNWIFQIETTGPDSGQLTEVHGLVLKIETDTMYWCGETYFR